MNQEVRIKKVKSRIESLIHNSLFIIRTSRGFTLIELLVAIGIIGVLSSFLLANFVGVRQRTRDGVRKFDLRQIQLALEAYRSDKSTYPDNIFLANCGVPFDEVADNDEDGVIYMKKIPCDPLGGNYFYSKDGNGYLIVACLENAKDSQQDLPPVHASCAGAEETNVSYTLRNP